MTTFRVQVGFNPQLDVVVDIKEISQPAEVVTPSSFFAVGWKQYTGFALAFYREHAEEKACRQRNVVELEVKRAGDDLVAGYGFAFGGTDEKVGVLEVTRGIGVVDAEEFVLFIFERMLYVHDTFSLFGHHFRNPGPPRAVIVDDVFSLVQVCAILEYGKANTLAGGVTPALGGEGPFVVVDEDFLCFQLNLAVDDSRLAVKPYFFSVDAGANGISGRVFDSSFDIALILRRGCVGPNGRGICRDGVVGDQRVGAHRKFARIANRGLYLCVE